MVKAKKKKKAYLEYFSPTGGLLPTRPGVYLAVGVWCDDEPREIDVYRHPVKGLCCFADDFGGGGSDVNDKYDCHTSVQFTGLEFIERVSSLD
ncbi:hypothetical protein COX97_00210 [Candidatus Pacearchaeota archaeon CG_4_10_14_0_2_um_filter_05_32_18]|nr:MAG: hypothetical protein COX97_00210 [Candidatus Pacearchaeota archaeon CG_4_10_14_0_2_um_filter_05_32_18]